MKTRFVYISFVFCLMLSLCACSASPMDASGNSGDELPTKIVQEKYPPLPSGYSLENIEAATKELINYQLWFYPADVWARNDESKAFDPYIGKKFHMDVRVYRTDSGEQQVYAKTSAGEWLIHYELIRDTIVGTDQVHIGESAYPQGNYESAGSFTVQVLEPHPPNYGTSPRKEKMIEAVEQRVSEICTEFQKEEDPTLWSGTEVYINNFYEYEESGAAWFVRQDGYAMKIPMQLAESNGEFDTHLGKGKLFILENIHSLDESQARRYMFESESKVAVGRMTCEVGFK